MSVCDEIHDGQNTHLCKHQCNIQILNEFQNTLSSIIHTIFIFVTRPIFMKNKLKDMKKRYSQNFFLEVIPVLLYRYCGHDFLIHDKKDYI